MSLQWFPLLLQHPQLRGTLVVVRVESGVTSLPSRALLGHPDTTHCLAIQNGHVTITSHYHNEAFSTQNVHLKRLHYSELTIPST